MSLKAFHIVFVTVSILLMLVIAGWCLGNYRDDGSTKDLAWGLVSVAGALVLAVYGWVFLRKYKNVSYL